MNERQQANFGSDNIIPPRTLKISRNAERSKASKEISDWVKEQGVAVGEDWRIADASSCLLELLGNAKELCSNEFRES